MGYINIYLTRYRTNGSLSVTAQYQLKPMLSRYMKELTNMDVTNGMTIS